MKYPESYLNESIGDSVREQSMSSELSHSLAYRMDRSKNDGDMSENYCLSPKKGRRFELDTVYSSKQGALGKLKHIKLTPKSVKRKTVTRSEIKLKSPSNPRTLHVFKRKETTPCKQRHLSNTNQNESSMVVKLRKHFEQNQTDSHIDLDKISGKDLSCIKSGSVKNAFDLLMLNKVGDTPSKTPRKKNLKRLEKRQITSRQKKLDNWVEK